jgi:hypothetical protein
VLWGSAPIVVGIDGVGTLIETSLYEPALPGMIIEVHIIGSCYFVFQDVSLAVFDFEPKVFHLVL